MNKTTADRLKDLFYMYGSACVDYGAFPIHSEENGQAYAQLKLADNEFVEILDKETCID